MADQELIIGKVSATEKMPSTIDDFYFWTDKGQILSPFDIVKVEHVHPDSGKSSVTYGVIEEINHVTDAASHFTSYISSDFGSTDAIVGNMNRLGMNYIKARVVCNTHDIYTPVLDGQQVSLCNKDDIETALGLKDVDNPLVCGYLEMYKGEARQRIKVQLNSHFLLGPDGAHINISGISGLAAKTSYSMFLLNIIQQKFIAENNESVAFVFFNVKGRDLMAIDERNDKLTEEELKEYSDIFEYDPTPFKNVHYYYPYSKTNKEHIQSYAHDEDFAAQKARNVGHIYRYSFNHSQDMLDLLLANEDDSTGTMESCVNYIINGEGDFNTVDSWKNFVETLDKCASPKSKDSSSRNNSEILVTSWRKFKRCIKKATANDVFFDKSKDGIDLTHEIQCNLTPNKVMVIDIAHLDENTQGFVFGSVARAIYDMKLGSDTDRTDIPDKVILFVDELNKYASNDVPKSSPILKQLLEITERGRSLGIILFGVEQFRSVIHDRIKGNCATQAYGRTNAIEVSKPDYRYIPKVYQNMMTRLTQGEYIISNPALRSTVNVKFPKPIYKQFPNG